jgi:hypothetical protein
MFATVQNIYTKQRERLATRPLIQAMDRESHPMRRDGFALHQNNLSGPS